MRALPIGVGTATGRDVPVVGRATIVGLEPPERRRRRFAPGGHRRVRPGQTRGQQVTARVARCGPTLDPGVTCRTSAGRRHGEHTEGDRAGQCAEHEPDEGAPGAQRRIPTGHRRGDTRDQDQDDRDAVEGPLHDSSTVERRTAMLPRSRRRACRRCRESSFRTPPFGAGVHRKCAREPAPNRAACDVRFVIASVIERWGPYDRAPRGWYFGVGLGGGNDRPGIGPQGSTPFPGEDGAVAGAGATVAPAQRGI